MDPENRRRLKSIWLQGQVPVILRKPDNSRPLTRLPNGVSIADGYHLLGYGRRQNPKWDEQHKCWETPTAWFNDIVRLMLKRFGKVYIIQPHTSAATCAPNCWNATGFVCECSCMGERHGAGHPGRGWTTVSDTFAGKWERGDLASRLLSV